MSTRRQHPPSARATDESAELRDRLEPVLHALGLVLEDVVVSTAGSRRLLKVVLDLPADQTGSVSLDAVAEASREISASLDDADPMGSSPYTLEVSSPGVDRPLTEPRHVRRNVGRLVELTLRNATVVHGRVLAVEDDDTLVLLLAGAKKGMPATKQRRVGWAEVSRAVVEVEFSHPDQPAPADDGDGSDDDDDFDDSDEGRS